MRSPKRLLNPFRPKAQWQSGSVGNDPQNTQGNAFLLAVGAVVAVVIVGVLGFRAGTPSEPTPIAEVSIPTPLVVTATPIPATLTPDCEEASVPLRTIQDMEDDNKWDQAAENAASALNKQRLCKQDRPALARRYVTDAMEGLYYRKFGPEKTSQQEALERYQTIKQQAQSYQAEYGIELPKPLGVAQRAAQSGKFLLAKFAYEEAYAIGTFNTADRASVTDYVSNLYNIGHWWTQQKDGPNYEEGLTYLVASYRVATDPRYATGQAEAWGRLRELLGPDETKWPQPVSTPLLN